MSASEPERKISFSSDSLASYINIEPPVDTFEQYLDVCEAVYGAIHGAEFYARPTIPKPHEGDFKNSLYMGTTELRALRKPDSVLEHASQQAAAVLFEKHGIPAVVELADAA